LTLRNAHKFGMFLKMTSDIDKYIFEIKNKLADKLQDVNFVGKISFEVNCKCGGITNMNIDHRESIKV
jgi:hypothetical protein